MAIDLATFHEGQAGPLRFNLVEMSMTNSVALVSTTLQTVLGAIVSPLSVTTSDDAISPTTGQTFPLRNPATVSFTNARASQSTIISVLLYGW